MKIFILLFGEHYANVILKIWNSQLLILKVKTETALENHVKSHSGIRDLKCHICDAAFASRYTLNAHVKRHAITEPLFSCPYCGNIIQVSMFYALTITFVKF